MEDKIEENFGKSLDDILDEYHPFNVDNINDLYNLLK
jgi:hypothetical protein